MTTTSPVCRTIRRSSPGWAGGPANNVSLSHVDYTTESNTLDSCRTDEYNGSNTDSCRIDEYKGSNTLFYVPYDIEFTTLKTSTSFADKQRKRTATATTVLLVEKTYCKQNDIFSPYRTRTLSFLRRYSCRILLFADLYSHTRLKTPHKYL